MYTVTSYKRRRKNVDIYIIINIICTFFFYYYYEFRTLFLSRPSDSETSVERAIAICGEYR